jgi:hypothetical protein
MNHALRVLLRFSAWLWAAVFWSITVIMLWDGCTSTQLRPWHRFLTFAFAFGFATIGFTPVAMERWLRRMQPGTTLPGIIFKSALMLGLSLPLLLGAYMAAALLAAIIDRLGGGTSIFG